MTSINKYPSKCAKLKLTPPSYHTSHVIHVIAVILFCVVSMGPVLNLSSNQRVIGVKINGAKFSQYTVYVFKVHVRTIAVVVDSQQNVIPPHKSDLWVNINLMTIKM